MKPNLQTLAVSATIAASFLTGCSAPKIIERTDQTRPSIVQTSEGFDTFGRKWEIMSRHESVLLNYYTGTIIDIDYPEREITLKGSMGQIETFVVDKKVVRFNEAKVGDKVTLDYYLGFDAEVRPPTDEEKQNPLVVLASTGRAGSDKDPSAYDMRKIRAVVTIVGIDKGMQTVTVKGPRGKVYTARVVDPSRLDRVRIGETILMTFTEAVAISLKPAADETAK